MRSVYWLGLTLAAALSCTNPIPMEPPLLRGNVTAPTSEGILVVAPGGEAACDVTQRAQVRLRDATIRRRSGGSAAVSDLVAGTNVSVWTTGAVMESCPPIVIASTVVIEEP